VLHRPDGKPLSQVLRLELTCLEGCFTWSGAEVKDGSFEVR
jgi:hypothetical protein